MGIVKTRTPKRNREAESINEARDNEIKLWIEWLREVERQEWWLIQRAIAAQREPDPRYVDSGAEADELIEGDFGV